MFKFLRVAFFPPPLSLLVLYLFTDGNYLQYMLLYIYIYILDTVYDVILNVPRIEPWGTPRAATYLHVFLGKKKNRKWPRLHIRVKGWWINRHWAVLRARVDLMLQGTYAWGRSWVSLDFCSNCMSTSRALWSLREDLEGDLIREPGRVSIRLLSCPCQPLLAINLNLTSALLLRLKFG